MKWGLVGEGRSFLPDQKQFARDIDGGKGVGGGRKDSRSTIVGVDLSVLYFRSVLLTT